MSCQWGERSQTVGVRSGQIVSGLRFAIRNGVLLNFRVVDARGRVADPKDLRLGVMSETGFYAHARAARRNGAEVQQVVAVPKNAVVRLFLDRRFEFDLEDGRPLQSGKPDLAVAAGLQDNLDVRLKLR